MHDLPVMATTAAAYRFLARELATIVRLTWATLVIVALIQYLVGRTVLAQMSAQLALGDVVGAAKVGRNPVWLTLKIGADLIVTAIVAVAIHRLILFGDRRHGQYFPVAFGKPERLFVVLAAALAAVMVPFASLVISPFGEPTTGLAPFLATLAFVVVIYLSIRLWPIFPIIVVEERFNFAGAWTLTRGRFWSLLALAVLGLIPVGIAGLIIDTAWPAFDSLMDAITGPREAMPHVARAAAAVQRAQAWLAWRVVLDFLTSVAYAGLAVALASYAYKALTGRPFDETLTKPE